MGSFPLRQYLGGSDHSAVFLTERRGRDPQRAAIKLIAVDPGNSARHLPTWEWAAKLAHPHLLQLFETGSCQLDNVVLLYVVMEFAEENLAQILPQRALTPEEARDLLEPALDALAFLHGKSLVHGRLKPSNILATQDLLKLSSDSLVRTDDSAGGVSEDGRLLSQRIRRSRGCERKIIPCLGFLVVGDDLDGSLDSALTRP